MRLSSLPIVGPSFAGLRWPHQHGVPSNSDEILGGAWGLERARETCAWSRRSHGAASPA